LQQAELQSKDTRNQLLQKSNNLKPIIWHMTIFNLSKIALKAMARNKMRTFLTMLGIIIGVTSVITMLAIGQGSKESIQEQISSMGANMIMIHPGSDMRGGVRMDPSSMQTLTLKDLNAIRRYAPHVSAISPMVSSGGQVIAGSNNWPTTIRGVSEDFLDIRKMKVAEGVMFTDYNVKRAEKVCLLGQTVVENLFPDKESAVGETIRFKNIPFKVILSYGMGSLLDWPIEVTNKSILLSFLVCAVVGIFFGWYPARKAAGLDPIEALRYE
jgi:ABC-type antimicrobial peptide transport system permease subunit